MLPKTIQGFLNDLNVELVDHLGSNLWACIDYEACSIRVLRSLPPSWQAQSLIHELTHLAFSINSGAVERDDEREEGTCIVIGRLLPKVLLDNPELLHGEPETVDILGSIWRVENVLEPDPESDGSSGWLHWRSYTMRCRAGTNPQLWRLRLFQMTCDAVLDAGGVEGYSDPYYRSMSATLYGLLRLNPGAHPRAVISHGEV